MWCVDRPLIKCLYEVIGIQHDGFPISFCLNVTSSFEVEKKTKLSNAAVAFWYFFVYSTLTVEELLNLKTGAQPVIRPRE